MLVVLASRDDHSSKRIVERWAPFGAGMITCEDLSVAGWRYHTCSPDASMAVVGSQVVWCENITGLLTRIPCVFGPELTRIRAEDREYVAAEMTAFLTAWLFSLSCPILNRPTAACLSGPNWRPEQWVRAAVGVGIPVRAVERHVLRAPGSGSSVPETSTVGVTVVGNGWFGAVDQALAAQAKSLAKAAGVDLLEVRFSGSEPGAHFVSANLWPDLSSPGVADAVLKYLRSGSPVQPPLAA
jgi:hypothetical protein